MNYAFMSFSCPTATLQEIIKLAKLYGYTGFEPRVESNHRHKIELDLNAAGRRDVKQIMQDSGIELCCLAIGTNYVNPQTIQEELDKTRMYLELASDIGASRLRVFGGNLAEEMSREEARTNLATALSELAPEASARAISICLETHDGWCNPYHVAEVMKLVNQSSIAVNWDVMHPVRAGGASMTEAFEVLRPWIKHTHVHDAENTLKHLRKLPMGTGDFDNKLALKHLKDMNYDGYISGEWIQSTMDEAFFATHLADEIKVLKRYETEL